MLKDKNQLFYKAFGFSIMSELPLNELPLLDNYVGFTDIEIKIEELTKKWNALTPKNYGFFIKNNIVMYNFENIAVFSIEEGKTIKVCPLKNYEEDVVRLIILGTCMGVILMQRKVLPLHGSAIVINGKAYTIIGDSGAGKSTLASAFLSEGHQLLTDDVIALSITKDNIPIITPSYPQQKLWEDSLLNFGLNKDDYQSIYGRETKFSVPVVTKQYSTKAIPLAAIFELVKTGNGEIKLEEVNGLSGIQTIFRNTYRNFIVPKLGLMDWHFKESANLLNKVRIYRLSRPNSEFNAPQLVSKILNTIGDINDIR